MNLPRSLPPQPDQYPLRVLVTGATGMLASVLVPLLSHAGIHVDTTARGGSVTFAADLTQPSEAVSVIEGTGPDAVVHLAAATDVDQCELDPQWAYLQNVRLTQNIAAACAVAPRPVHLVHISTDHVYDSEGPHAEDAITVRNHYAMSKLAGELAALHYAGTTVLRTNFTGRSARAGRISFSDWVVASLRGGKPIEVFGDVMFSPLRMQTLSQAIARVLSEPCHGVFNLGSRGTVSKAQMAHVLAQGLRLDAGFLATVQLAGKGLAARRPTGMGMDSARFEQAFTWPLPTIEEEMQALVQEYSNDV